jgi:hypothetical protein
MRCKAQDRTAYPGERSRLAPRAERGLFFRFASRRAARQPTCQPQGRPQPPVASARCPRGRRSEVGALLRQDHMTPLDLRTCTVPRRRPFPRDGAARLRYAHDASLIWTCSYSQHRLGPAPAGLFSRLARPGRPQPRMGLGPTPGSRQPGDDPSATPPGTLHAKCLPGPRCGGGNCPSRKSRQRARHGCTLSEKPGRRRAPDRSRRPDCGAGTSALLGVDTVVDLHLLNIR